MEDGASQPVSERRLHSRTADEHTPRPQDRRKGSSTAWCFSVRCALHAALGGFLLQDKRDIRILQSTVVACLGVYDIELSIAAYLSRFTSTKPNSDGVSSYSHSSSAKMSIL
jgi:hypothetical protein